MIPEVNKILQYEIPHLKTHTFKLILFGIYRPAEEIFRKIFYRQNYTGLYNIYCNIHVSLGFIILKGKLYNSIF